MKWSWKVATVRGIELYIHGTFLLLLGWILFSHLIQGHGLGMALTGVTFILLLFLCVVLHEFGHALTAQRFGVRTRDITLYPIGGIARLERIPREPSQELLIALAGPAVNVVIAAGLFAALWAGNALIAPDGVRLVGGSLLGKLMWVNVTLALFNLLPAFPMDGGRVLRALLATRMEYGRATQIAAGIGQGMAFLFGFIGLMYNPLLLFIALFVYMGAAQEAATVSAELAFRGVPVRGAMMTHFRTLAPGESLGRAAEVLLSGAQHEFPVVENDAVVGILTREGLIEGLTRDGPGGLVGRSMSPAPPGVDPGESLEATFQRMRESDAQSIPVLDGGRIVGLITLENIGELLMVRNAVGEQRRERVGGLAPQAPRDVVREAVPGVEESGEPPRRAWSGPRERGIPR